MSHNSGSCGGISPSARSNSQISILSFLVLSVFAQAVACVGDEVTAAAGGASFDFDSKTELLQELNLAATKLEATFEHKFSAGLPGQYFAINGNDACVKQLDDGMGTWHRNGIGVNGIRTCIQLHGDFDVTVKFRNLDVSFSGDQGRAGVGLLACFENETQDNFAVYRRNDKAAAEERFAFVHRVLQSDGRVKHAEKNKLVRATAGRLRMVRHQGSLYALCAPDEAAEFTLIGLQHGVKGDLGVQGLRLVLQGGPQAETSVVWEELTVRAERITGRPIDDSLAVVETLNSRAPDAVDVQLDFTDEGVVDAICRLDAGAKAVREQNNDGLRLTLISEQASRSAAITMPIHAPDNFDVAAAIDVHQLETPEPGAKKSEVVMQVRLEEVDSPSETTPIEVSLLLRPDYRGGRTLIARYVARNRAGKMIYRPIRDLPVRSHTELRIAFRNRTVFFLYAEDGEDQQVVAEYSVNVPLQANSVILSAHARDRGYITDVTWKSLRVTGEGQFE